MGAIVVDEHDRLLVVQRGREPARGRWTVPGGRVEWGERLEEAVAREVAEETSLVVEVHGFVGHAEVVTDLHHTVILDFAATVVSGEAVAGDDAAAVAWMGRAELAAAGPTVGLLEFLDQHGIALAP